MPIIKSSAKRMRQNQTRYRENLRAKRRMRQAIKDVSEHIASNKEKEAREYLDVAQKAIDKAVKKGVVNKNTAARKKSQLARRTEKTFGTPTAGSRGTGKKSSGTSTKQTAGKSTSQKNTNQSKSSTASSGAKQQSSTSKSSSGAKKQTSSGAKKQAPQSKQGKK